MPPANASPRISLFVFGGLLVFGVGYALMRPGKDEPPPKDDLPKATAAAPQPAVMKPTVVPETTAARVEREAAVDVKSNEQLAAAFKREAELVRDLNTAKAELRSVRFAAAIAEFEKCSLADALKLMEHSYLTEPPEIRELFVATVLADKAAELLREEPKLRAEMAKLKSTGTPEYRQFEWPVARDHLINTFVQRLVDAGVSPKAIEMYRISLADYL